MTESKEYHNIPQRQPFEYGYVQEYDYPSMKLGTSLKIDDNWYRVMINDSGRSNYLAVSLLSDLTYWYNRNKAKRKKNAQDINYQSNYLQTSYASLCEKFHASRYRIYRAIVLLEKLGLIQRHLKNIKTFDEIHFACCMHLELKIDAINKITNVNKKRSNTVETDQDLLKYGH